ncbi:MAG: amidohydrolase family protein [Clostridia bacterium]|nr:amidohydrolase family protein [Clostridia bacterium]
MMKKMDMHIHTYGDISMDQMVAYMEEMKELRGYCGLGFMACLRNSSGFVPDSNEVTLELKRRIPGSYAFAGLDHGKDFVEQAKQFMEQGFDGIKMLEGKPSLYRFWGIGYEGPRMDEFFAYAEEQDIPLVIHNNDPRANWDPNGPRVEHLRGKGWYYGDGDVPSQEEFFLMLEGVFDRHPNLRAALSHMGFYYDNLPRVSALMEKCPNLYLDLTPAVEVFMELSLTPAETKAFIEKYQKRMFWGTDTSVNWAPDSRIRTFNDQKVRMMEVFFEGTEPEVVAGKYPVAPVGLDPAILEDIYYYNALRFMKKI